jgi:hypothetical protein
MRDHALKPRHVGDWHLNRIDQKWVVSITAARILDQPLQLGGAAIAGGG